MSLNLFVPRGIRREIQNGESQCFICKQFKPLQEFYLNKHGNPDGRCKDCCRIYIQMQRYGLTEEQYRQLYDPPLCCICASDGSNSKLGLSIDHCHETNVIRGLLCARCNYLVGWIEKVQKGARSELAALFFYLDNHRNIVPAAPISVMSVIRVRSKPELASQYRRGGSTYELTDPHGKTFVVGSLKAFCSEYGFDENVFHAVVKQGREMVKKGRAAGWCVRRIVMAECANHQD